jgi:hypothetical protein
MEAQAIEQSIEGVIDKTVGQASHASYEHRLPLVELLKRAEKDEEEREHADEEALRENITRIVTATQAAIDMAQPHVLAMQTDLTGLTERSEREAASAQESFATSADSTEMAAENLRDISKKYMENAGQRLGVLRMMRKQNRNDMATTSDVLKYFEGKGPNFEQDVMALLDKAIAQDANLTKDVKEEVDPKEHRWKDNVSSILLSLAGIGDETKDLALAGGDGAALQKMMGSAMMYLNDAVRDGELRKDGQLAGAQRAINAEIGSAAHAADTGDLFTQRAYKALIAIAQKKAEEERKVFLAFQEKQQREQAQASGLLHKARFVADKAEGAAIHPSSAARWQLDMGLYDSQSEMRDTKDKIDDAFPTAFSLAETHADVGTDADRFRQVAQGLHSIAAARDQADSVLESDLQALAG